MKYCMMYQVRHERRQGSKPDIPHFYRVFEKKKNTKKIMLKILIQKLKLFFNVAPSIDKPTTLGQSVKIFLKCSNVYFKDIF
jgi:hypothetical protein